MVLRLIDVKELEGGKRSYNVMTKNLQVTEENDIAERLGIKLDKKGLKEYQKSETLNVFQRG